MNKIYVGIDPDVDKSGFAIWKDKELAIKKLRFFEIFDELSSIQKTFLTYDLVVVIEAGWLNKKSNWHNENSNTRMASKVGINTGANHETGRKLVEMCEYLSIPYHLVVPKSSKVDAITFEKLTKYHKRINQDMRDAAMLVFGL